MKKLTKALILIAAWLIAMQATAQSGFHYQAAVRNAQGEVMANESLSIRIAIRGDNRTFYQETQSSTTNDFGILNLVVGHGSSSDDLSSIPWGDDLSMEVSVDMGSGFTTLGNSPIMPVPYAMVAGAAQNSEAGIADAFVNNQGELTIVLTDEQTINVGSVEGPAGEQGPKGDPGDRGPEGAQGEPGKDGTGVRIIGSVATEGDLDNSHDGEIGDMVIVEATGSGFVWNGSNWTEVGSIQGPRGEQGPKGDPGATGAKGDKGDKGDPGADGAAGAKGDKGDKGDPGADGAAGAKGDKGDKGDPGADGAAGAKGDKGDKGDPGTNGAPGAKGDPGVDGQDGRGISDVVDLDNILTVKYDDGTQKSVGNYKGPKGDRGEPGLPGPQGVQGERGFKGSDGSDGINCWDLDGDGINDSSEDVNRDGRWNTLDCQGPKGDKGDPGSGGGAFAFGSVNSNGTVLYSGSGNWKTRSEQGLIIINVGTSLQSNNCAVTATHFGGADTTISFKGGELIIGPSNSGQPVSFIIMR